MRALAREGFFFANILEATPVGQFGLKDRKTSRRLQKPQSYKVCKILRVDSALQSVENH
jgi:hypothetical protein